MRTALFLSMLLDRPFRVERIRFGRPKPGLKAQHVTILDALQRMSSARIEGARLGSDRIDFRPGGLRAGTYEVDVGTAGAIPLVLQTLLPVCLLSPGEIVLRIRGGTEASMAPTYDWWSHVLVPLVAPAYEGLEARLLRRGFLPAGGGLVELRTRGHGADPSSVVERVQSRLGGAAREASPPWRIRFNSVAHETLRAPQVAERQADAFRRAFPQAEGTFEYVPADSPGSSLAAWAEDAQGNRLGADALGERGRTSEAVAERAAAALGRALSSQGSADEHLADHLVPWVGLGMRGFRPSHASAHFLTNLEIARRFLGADALRWDGARLEPGRATL